MVVRINIRKVKALVWLASSATFVFAGWTFYDIFTQKQAKHYENRSRDFFVQQVLKANVREQAGPSQKPFYAKERYEKLWDTLIDGSIRVVEPAPGDKQPDVVKKPEAPPIDTVVDVGLILWSPEPESRFVAITYKTPGAPGTPAAGGAPGSPAAAAAAGAAAAVAVSGEGKELRLHLSEGDPLKPPFDGQPYNGKVLSIALQEVTFQWGEGEVTVTPGLGVNGSGEPLRLFTVPSPEDVAAGITERPDTTTQIRPGHWLMGSQDLARVNRDPQHFLEEQINVRTVSPAAGGNSSLKLTSDPPAGSLAAQFGAKKGDKIISVNGIPMSSLSSAINWFKQNSDLPNYVVVYEPAGTGKQETITIHVK
jgi:hypothetical protein